MPTYPCLGMCFVTAAHTSGVYTATAQPALFQAGRVGSAYLIVIVVRGTTAVTQLQVMQLVCSHNGAGMAIDWQPCGGHNGLSMEQLGTELAVQEPDWPAHSVSPQ